MLTAFFHDEFPGAWPRNLHLVSRNRDHSDLMKQLQPVMNLDIVEKEKEYCIHAELPGVEKSNVDLKVHQGLLTITAEKKNSFEETTTKLHHVERSYGTVSRSVQLPKNVEPSDVRASFEDGVLEVTLPKKQNTPPPGGISVMIQ